MSDPQINQSDASKAAMTWLELLNLLKGAQSNLKAHQGNELEKEELLRLVTKLKRKMGFAGFESLAQITAVPLTDLTQFKTHIEELGKAIQEGKTGQGSGFSGILKGILSTAKTLILPL